MHGKDMINAFILKQYCKIWTIKNFLSTSWNKVL